MRKSIAHASSLLMAMLFLLPLVASADQVIYNQPDNGTAINGVVNHSTYDTATIYFPSAVTISSVQFYCGLDPFVGAAHDCVLNIAGNGATTTLGTAEVLTAGVQSWTFPVSASLSAGTYRLSLTDNVSGDSQQTKGSASHGFSVVLIGTGVGAINWGALYFPAVYSTSSAAIAASSSLWSSLTIASSSPSCVDGNFLTNAICSSFTFLFLPNQTILNEYSDLISTTSPSSIVQKFPFSWAYSFQTLVSGLSAGTSTMMTIQLNLSGMVASTTSALPNILPNVTLLSKDTIVGPYISQTLWDTLQGLIIAMLWLALFADIYHYLRHRIHRV